jgi:NADH-quinone oxidoreductase subunit E
VPAFEISRNSLGNGFQMVYSRRNPKYRTNPFFLHNCSPTNHFRLAKRTHFQSGDGAFPMWEILDIWDIRVLNWYVHTPSDPAIDDLIARYRGRPGALLGILEAVQERNPRKYICQDELRYIAAKTNLPLARIFSVVTFYALFNLEPQGDHTICICRGTACHARGSRNLLDTLRLELGMEEVSGENGADKLMLTTPDGRFTIRTVACFGQCALAPVVELDNRICGHMNEGALVREVGALAEAGQK